MLFFGNSYAQKKSINRTATLIFVENQLDKQLLHNSGYNYNPLAFFLYSPVYLPFLILISIMQL